MCQLGAVPVRDRQDAVQRGAGLPGTATHTSCRPMFPGNTSLTPRGFLSLPSPPLSGGVAAGALHHVAPQLQLGNCRQPHPLLRRCAVLRARLHRPVRAPPSLPPLNRVPLRGTSFSPPISFHIHLLLSQSPSCSDRRMCSCTFTSSFSSSFPCLGARRSWAPR